MTLRLDDIQAVDFIGIGGIGMSALARYFHARGVRVSGYDRTETPLTKALADAGMQVRYTENVAALPTDIDLVIYTPAVPDSHAELRHYWSEGVPVHKRAEVLGIISRGMRCLAVAGTHGKTTTTTLATYLIRSGGVAASAFLGGIARDFGSNFVAGDAAWIIVEADEYDRSFLHLDPEYAVITSLDADHLDIYGDREQMLDSGFRAFAQKVPATGQLLLRHGLSAELRAEVPTATFGIDAGDYRAERVRVEDGYFVFDFHWPEGQLADWRLPLPGDHNVANTIAALALAIQAGADVEKMRRALPEFRGIGRRFEFIVREADTVFIDDYAHHPTELRAAIGAARKLYPQRRITGVFQPHLFSRTRDFADEFAAALDTLDEAWLLDIYPAREEPIAGVTSQWLLDKMTSPRRRLLTKDELLTHLKEHRPEVLLTLGAGDIDRLVDPIKENLLAAEPARDK